jgi:hypothetical protein
MGCQPTKKIPRKDLPTQPDIPKVINLRLHIQDKRIRNQEVSGTTLVEEILSEVKLKYATDEIYIKLDSSNEIDLRMKTKEEVYKLSKDKENLDLHIRTNDIDYITDWTEEYNRIKYVGKLFTNPLQIAIFDKINQKIYTHVLKNDVIENFSMNDLTEGSASCNGQDNLYISGENSRNMWVISLSDCEVSMHPTLLSDRTFHSMIYIPDKYVFIVGGEGNKQVDYFNTQTGVVTHHSTMNEQKIEPALAFVDEGVLWAFSNDINQFERNRIYTSSQWEKINIRTDITFDKKFYAVSHHAANELILLGGYSDSEDSYIFNYSDNTLTKTTINNKNIYFGSEKYFLPIGDINVLFGQITSEELKILIYSGLQLKEYHYEIDPDYAKIERVIRSIFKSS